MVGTMAGMVLYCAVAAAGGEQLIIAGCTGIGCADMAMGCGGCAWWWGAMAIGCGGNGWWWGVMAIGCIVWWCGVMAICCGGIAWWCGIITGCGGIACWCGVMDMGPLAMLGAGVRCTLALVKWSLAVVPLAVGTCMAALPLVPTSLVVGIAELAVELWPSLLFVPECLLVEAAWCWFQCGVVQAGLVQAGHGTFAGAWSLLG